MPEETVVKLRLSVRIRDRSSDGYDSRRI